ncbi:pentapeptide repeat-containing protein [Burkholderia sp. Bp8986]|uniref:pentapeptide repeat-containing protein n=1 Tax=Burkholderia sp. Bp8986 TaxID=2184550 RepID=UPI000F592F6A|nr:pentapeptide repeat-containing protein [Burkholderia sp. Bp8986]RQS43917.1 hypothetical protein DID99_34755 [Burkholderia sp. Bp8986]
MVGTVTITHLEQIDFAQACGVDLTGTMKYKGRCFTIARHGNGQLAATIRGDVAGVDPDAQTLTSRLNHRPTNVASLGGAELEEFLHSGVKLHGARFNGCSFKGVSMCKLDLKGCVFKRCSFTGANLDDCVLDNASFTQCKIKNAKMEGASLSNALFAACDFNDVNLEKWILNAVHFVGCDFDMARMPRALDGAVFRTCHLTNARLEGCSLNGSYFQECTLTRAKMGGARLVGAVFSKCNLDDAGLVYIHCAGAHFFDCQAAGCNFSGATLTGTVFKNFRAGRTDDARDARQTSFRQAKLEAAKFYNCELLGADFSGGGLSDAVLTGAVMVKSKLNGATFGTRLGEAMHVDEVTAATLAGTTLFRNGRPGFSKADPAHEVHCDKYIPPAIPRRHRHVTEQTTWSIYHLFTKCGFVGGAEIPSDSMPGQAEGKLVSLTTSSRYGSTGSFRSTPTLAVDLLSQRDDSLTRRVPPGRDEGESQPAYDRFAQTAASLCGLVTSCGFSGEDTRAPSQFMSVQAEYQSLSVSTSSRCHSTQSRQSSQSSEIEQDESSDPVSAPHGQVDSKPLMSCAPQTQDEFQAFTQQPSGDAVELILDGSRWSVGDEAIRALLLVPRMHALRLINCTALTGEGYAAIANLSVLRSLSVEFAGYDLAQWQADSNEVGSNKAGLLDHLARLTKLESLALVDCRFDHAGLLALKDRTSLKSFSVAKCFYTAQLGTAISQIQSLETLDLSDMRASETVGLQFLGGLKLKSLLLTNMPCDSATFGVLASMDTLQTLHAGGIASVNLALPVFSSDGVFRNLRSLQVEHCYQTGDLDIERAAIATVGKREEGFRLERTSQRPDFNYTDVAAGQVAAFLAQAGDGAIGVVLDRGSDADLYALASDRRVRGLHLTNCVDLTGTVCAAIAELPGGSALQVLSIDRHGLDATSLTKLVSSLADLRSIGFSDRDFYRWSSSDAQTVFFSQLANLQKLESLTLRKCSFNHASLAALKDSRSLKSLSLAGCFYIESLDTAISQIESLQTLDLSKMNGVIHRLQFLERLNLKSLLLTQTECQPEVFRALALMGTLEKLYAGGIPYVNLADSAFNDKVGAFRNLRLLQIERCHLTDQEPAEQAALTRFGTRKEGVRVERTALLHSNIR